MTDEEYTPPMKRPHRLRDANRSTTMLIVIREHKDHTWELKITEHRNRKKFALRYACYRLPSGQAAVSQLIDWQAGIIVV